MKQIITSIFGALALVAAAAPSVSNVSVTHSGRIVTVDYTLSEAPAIVTAEFATNGVPIDCGRPFAMVGDVARLVTTEQCRFRWTVDVSWPGADIAPGALSVTLKAWAPATPPDYLVVDFVSRSKLYFASEASLPGGIGNPEYRSTKLVMRRIPASNQDWRMGCISTYPYQGNASWETNHYVRITKDYYIGVFPITQGLYRHFFGAPPEGSHSVEAGYPDGDLKPLTYCTYNSIRGGGWPKQGSAVDDKGLLDLMRVRTGIQFDLPTEVQWEYACRAGTETCHYAGNTAESVQEIAWTSDNWRDDPVAASQNRNQTHAVGLKKPNAFGLYDMLGNIYEFVLDRFTEDLTGEEFYLDSVGPQTGNDRVTRSGHWALGYNNSNSHYRRKCDPNAPSVNNGFRLACPCPVDGE